MIKKIEQCQGDDKSLLIEVREVNGVGGEALDNKKANEGCGPIVINITNTASNERPETPANPSVGALWYAFYLWLMSKFKT